jgi:hypothetical protein
VLIGTTRIGSFSCRTSHNRMHMKSRATIKFPSRLHFAFVTLAKISEYAERGPSSSPTNSACTVSLLHVSLRHARALAFVMSIDKSRRTQIAQPNCASACRVEQDRTFGRMILGRGDDLSEILHAFRFQIERLHARSEHATHHAAVLCYAVAVLRCCAVLRCVALLCCVALRCIFTINAISFRCRFHKLMRKSSVEIHVSPSLHVEIELILNKCEFLKVFASE